MKKHLGLVCLLSLLLVTPTLAMDFGIRLWNQELSGGLGATSSGVSGVANIIENGGTETGFFFKGLIFDLEYTPISNSNVLSGSGTFDFAGQTFDFNENARMDAKIEMFDIFFRKKLFSGVGQSFHLLLGAKIANTQFIVSADDPLNPGTRLVENVDETVPIPQIGFMYTNKISKMFRFDGSLKYLDVDIEDVEVKVTDLKIGASYVTPTGLSIDLGYREYKLEASYDQGSADAAYVNFKYSGPFFGATYRF